MNAEDIELIIRDAAAERGGKISSKELEEYLKEKYRNPVVLYSEIIADFAKKYIDEIPGKHASLIRSSCCWVTFSEETGLYQFSNEIEISEDECKYLTALYLKEEGKTATTGMISRWVYSIANNCIGAKTKAIAPSRSGETKLDQLIRNIISHCNEKENGPVYFAEGFWVIENKDPRIRNRWIFSAFPNNEV